MDLGNYNGNEELNTNDEVNYFEKARFGYEEPAQKSDNGFDVYDGEESQESQQIYDEFMQSENRKAQRDKLVWNYVYTIMNLLTFGSTIYSTSSTVTESLLSGNFEETIIKLLIISIPFAWSVFACITMVNLLQGKKDGIKMVKIKTLVDIITKSVATVLSLLFTFFVVAFGHEIAQYAEGAASSLAPEVFIGIGVGITISVLVANAISLGVAIFTRKYYKDREHLFTA